MSFNFVLDEIVFVKGVPKRWDGGVTQIKQ
jgi:hypothetical protein